jgi:hypothetical protein
MKTKNVVPVVAITLFIAFAARTWTGLDTPDSSFYTTLALFGDQITDRAPFDSYYWTRLGYIAPLHGLYTITGVDLGFFLYRLALIAILVTSIYVILAKTSQANTATRIFITTAAASSTVILGYLGNPYLTGFILVATAAAIATTTTHTSTTQRTLLVAITGGVIMGWSAQVNPAGAVLVGMLWLATSLFIHYVIAGMVSLITFFVFILLGKLIFPSLNWWDTFNSTREMNLSDFASANLVWLGDISLLVPLAVLLVALTAWLRDRTNNSLRLALVISSVSVTFMLVFSPIMGGIALEAPMYQSMLWPPAMIAI